MNTRTLGVVCMLGSAVVTLDAIRMALISQGLNQDFSTINLITGILWGVGAIAGLIGMIRLNVLGSNPVVRALGFLPIIGFGILILANILQLAGVYTTQTNTPAGIGWMAELSGMVVVGILAIAAKTWRGWQRFLPLLLVVTAPLAYALGTLIQNFNLAIAPYYALWILFGYLVERGDVVEARQKFVAV
jgi:hypothetical protein